MTQFDTYKRYALGVLKTRQTRGDRVWSKRVCHSIAECRGRVMKLCPFDQEAMESTCQKIMATFSSTCTKTATSSQTELLCECATTQTTGIQSTLPRAGPTGR